MKLFVALLFIAASAHCKTFEVTNSGQLNSALNSVNPGDTINLHDGNYNGNFVSSRSGNDGAKITLTGSNNAMLSSSNYGFNLKGNHWILRGFTVLNSLKGIVLDSASHNVLQDLHVRNIKQEGIHLRRDSSDNIIQNCNIHDTGKQNPGFGEGIYIGQAVNNWVNGQPDRSDRNQILNNIVGPNVAAESIDIKEGTCCGVVRGNNFDGHGETGENYSYCLVNVHGNQWMVEDNTANAPYDHGFDVNHIDAAGSVGGCDNTIRNNRCVNLPNGGQCAINNSKNCANTVTNNN